MSEVPTDNHLSIEELIAMRARISAVSDITKLHPAAPNTLANRHLLQAYLHMGWAMYHLGDASGAPDLVAVEESPI